MAVSQCPRPEAWRWVEDCRPTGHSGAARFALATTRREHAHVDGRMLAAEEQRKPPTSEARRRGAGWLTVRQVGGDVKDLASGRQLCQVRLHRATHLPDEKNQTVFSGNLSVLRSRRACFAIQNKSSSCKTPTGDRGADAGRKHVGMIVRVERVPVKRGKGTTWR